MHPNEQLIQTFYTAFQAGNAAGMNACYDAEVVFTDPVFGRLQGDRARAMWQMLCGRAKDLQISFTGVQADAGIGKAHWEARYSFGKAGRPVHNIIEATFIFQNGLINQHTDHFDLWRWSRMALGPIGIFLGWTPMIQATIQKDALRGLDQFMHKQTSST